MSRTGVERPLSIVFRADSSVKIGTGHVMRCLTLAHALAERGVDISFVCREHDGNVSNLIESQGLSVYRLPLPTVGAESEATSAHADWLGCSWREDVDQTRRVIEGLGAKPEWLVLDHYAIDRRWETAVRETVKRIMVIDDLIDRPHDCDLLLDQNLVSNQSSSYRGLVPDHCGLMLGPEYALLQNCYSQLHEQIPPREGPIRRILIYFGGADADNFTDRTLAAFIQLKRSDIDVDVVVADAGGNAKAVQDRAAGHSGIYIHKRVPSLAPLIAAADLGIGAAGATTWERLCLGLPSLVVSLAENQRPIASSLQKHGLARWLGHRDEVSQDSIKHALAEALSHDLDEAWSTRCQRTLDGGGTARVVDILTTTGTSPLRVRNARVADEKLLFDWANDPSTRRNAFTTEEIPLSTHRSWFRSRLRNLAGCRIYVVETETGVPVGQVRFELKTQAWEVSYSLASHMRGRGLGRPMLEAALIQLRTDIPGALVVGKVKDNNRASLTVFEHLDFDVQSAVNGMVIFQRLA